MRTPGTALGPRLALPEFAGRQARELVPAVVAQAPRISRGAPFGGRARMR